MTTHFNNTSFPKVMLIFLGVPWNLIHNQEMGTYQPILNNDIEFITIGFLVGKFLNVCTHWYSNVL